MKKLTNDPLIGPAEAAVVHLKIAVLTKTY